MIVSIKERILFLCTELPLTLRHCYMSAGSDHQSKVSTLNTSSDYWVAVKELKLSDYKMETLSFTVHPYCGF